MLLEKVITASATVAATSSRKSKINTLSDCLHEASADDSSGTRVIELVTHYLSGGLPQRRLGLSRHSLRGVPAPSLTSSVTVINVDDSMAQIMSASGPGAAETRLQTLHYLFARSTAAEQRWLAAVISGDIRQGAGEGLILQAVAQAAGLEATIVRATAMRAGDIAPVAAVLLRAGDIDEALASLAMTTVQPGRPVRPMLAGSATLVPDAMSNGDIVAVERKLDGIRIQAHVWNEGGDRHVRIFTRSLDDITDRVPEAVEAIRELPVTSGVFDGELIALRPDGSPQPFQVTSARTGSSQRTEELRVTIPLTTHLFDMVHRDGHDLLDRPAAARWSELSDVAPELTVARLVTGDPEAAAEFFVEQVAAGHEGVIVKSLDAPYISGSRGDAWVKVKPRHTFDLVVTAIEWGSGRRKGWLSNIHLAAQDESTGELVMVGKTFKGMTDEMLRWQTQRFGDLEVRTDGHIVHVDPVQVVEIAVDGLQQSSRYAGGVALRFARVLGYREDKSVSEIDSLQHLMKSCGTYAA